MAYGRFDKKRLLDDIDSMLNYLCVKRCKITNSFLRANRLLNERTVRTPEIYETAKHIEQSEQYETTVRIIMPKSYK